ncbi:hypothetical protein DL546_002722 [Coniochaeta pulveracea]|uniref:Uncharacterized protein n=1 Tax=Coniochaeta pulveracea TaxID=177199 RepID=A0A420Y113_9PEZI|nr:hypothetical protein DL546_002722 [Coniochaeta pulveracea]
MMASGQDTRFFENVALLLFLTVCPSSPSTNPLPPLADSQGPVRTLSFERERSLASGLAFLAGPSDNPNHIVAACVEENSSKDGLSVLLAINKARPRDAEGVLDTTRHGLQGVLNVLAEVRYNSDRPQLEHRVLQAVVSLSRKRILQRIGSDRTGYNGKPTTRLASVLEKATAIVGKRSQQGNLTLRQLTMADLFIKASNVLEAVLCELELCSASDINPRLLQVIQQASRLSKTVHLPDLLDDVPARDIEPQLAGALARRIRKLGRYYSFTRYLYQTAKNTKLFRQAVVKTVTLSPDCFVKAQSGAPKCNLEDCLGRCQQSKGSKKQLYQNLDTDFTQLNDKIAATVTQTSSGAKIHAEIQILAHYESNPSRLPPRVISSNKDACYLCHELIRIHGKYHTPRSHGRLYPGWKLPVMTVFPSLQKRLNQALEARIAAACSQILASGRKLPVDYPLESTVFVLSASMSTIPSLASGMESLREVTAPSSNEMVTGSPCQQATTEHTVEIASPKHSVDAVILGSAEDKRTDSGYGTISALETLDHRLNLEQLTPPETDEPLQPSSVTEERPVVSVEACAKDDSSSVDSDAVQDVETVKDTQLPGPHHETNFTRPEARDNVTQPDQDVKERAAIDADESGDPLSIGNSPARRSAFILKKGVVVQCRPTDYRYFRAANLSIFPEMATDSIYQGRMTECKLKVEWLENVDEDMPVMDAQALSETAGTDTSGRFFLQHEDTVLKVEVIRV